MGHKEIKLYARVATHCAGHELKEWHMWPQETKLQETGAWWPVSASHVQLTKRSCLSCGANPGPAHFHPKRAASARDTSLRRESFAR